MAVIVPADPYRVWGRTIGYSVGLESTFERVRDLTDEYESENDLTYGAWMTLVRDRWRLRNDNVADVFASLNVIRRQGRSVFVLPVLDALLIERKLVPRQAHDTALRFTLGGQIVLADGDVFLNCLDAEFREAKVREKLLAMGEYKLRRLKGVYRTAAVLGKLERIVKIESQPNNEGGAVRVKALSDSRRVAPLRNRTIPLGSVDPRRFEISEDFLRKAPPRRRDWAISLGLCEQDGQVTQAGHTFLAAWRDAGYYDEGAFTVWPLRPELARLGLRAAALHLPDLGTWEFLLILRRAMGAGRGPVSWCHEVHERGLSELRQAFETYRTAYRSKQILRNELPLQIALDALVGAAFGATGEVLPYWDIIDKERRSDKARVDLRSSRNEGSLVFRGGR